MRAARAAAVAAIAIACEDARDFRKEVWVLVPDEGESYRVRFRLLDESGTPRSTAWTEPVGIF